MRGGDRPESGRGGYVQGMRGPMKIVYLASEAHPFAKTGGLADVAGSLPRAVAALGHQVVLMMPAYRVVREAGLDLHSTGIALRVAVGDRFVSGSVLRAVLPGSGVPVYLIDQPAYFDRPGLYGDDEADYPDNCERFVFFQRAALEATRILDLRPDIVHGNDWQTGLVPVYLEEVYRGWAGSGFRGTSSVLTIHNLAYQGSFWPVDMGLTGLDPDLFRKGLLEWGGQLNFLKAGIMTADLVTTVSPTYAREIQEAGQGRYLEGVLRERAARGELVGIVNGIDPEEWSPRTDRYLTERYDVTTWPWGKAACKADLQRRAGLPERPDVPLFATIGRLDVQKGWGLILSAADELFRADLQLVVLGTGPRHYRQALRTLEERYPERLRVFLEFSQPLAHQIEAGADLFLMPSQYEPCGLNQLYSLAYGTIPVARATGGLVDTIVDATGETLAEGRANGVLFRDFDVPGLLWAVGRALELWRDPRRRAPMVRAGMTAGWTWDRSAREYVGIYERLLERRSSLS